MKILVEENYFTIIRKGENYVRDTSEVKNVRRIRLETTAVEPGS